MKSIIRSLLGWNALRSGYRRILLSSIVSLGFTFGLKRFIPLSFGMLGVVALLSHEFGHYIVALYEDLHPEVPLFFFFGFFSLGATHIPGFEEASKDIKLKVLRAGPIAGACISIFSGMIAALFLRWSFTLHAFTVGVKELAGLKFGSDANAMRSLGVQI